MTSIETENTSNKIPTQYAISNLACNQEREKACLQGQSVILPSKSVVTIEEWCSNNEEIAL